MAFIVVVTVLPIPEMHAPVAGFVSHREMLNGNIALPVSAELVMLPLVPTFTVATANTPVPFDPGIFTIPSPLGVAANATMSGTGVAETEKNSVLIPDRIDAGKLLAQSKLNSTSVGAIGAVGVNAKPKL